MENSLAPSQDSSSSSQDSASLQSSAEDDQTTSPTSRTPSPHPTHTSEEAHRLSVFSPAPANTNVRDFAYESDLKPWMVGDPKILHRMHRPLELSKCFREVIEWLPPTEAEEPLPLGFNKFREQSMLDYYPDVTKWVSRGKPLAPWDDTNRNKMLDLLTLPNTQLTFGAFAYVPRDSDEEEDGEEDEDEDKRDRFRELVLSVPEYFSYFRGGHNRICAPAAKTVKYHLTGGSDWGDLGRKAGSAFKRSCMRPKEDWFLHNGEYWTAAPPENEDEDPTGVLKWGRDPSTIVGAPFEWGWFELDPKDEELEAEVLQLWNGPMRFETKAKDTDRANSGDENAASATETV